MTQKNSSKQKLQRLTTAAVLSALSLVLMVTIRFPIFPAAPFYEMEFADVPILICSSLLGPLYSLAALLVVCTIQALTVSSSSGIIGFLMHFLSSGLMILTIWFVRKLFKDKGNGIVSVIASSLVGVVAVVLVMIPMNIWLTSAFMNLSLDAFIKDILKVCIAFNMIKAGCNILLFDILSPQVIKAYKSLTKQE